MSEAERRRLAAGGPAGKLLALQKAIRYALTIQGTGWLAAGAPNATEARFLTSAGSMLS